MIKVRTYEPYAKRWSGIHTQKQNTPILTYAHNYGLHAGGKLNTRRPRNLIGMDVGLKLRAWKGSSHLWVLGYKAFHCKITFPGSLSSSILILRYACIANMRCRCSMYINALEGWHNKTVHMAVIISHWTVGHIFEPSFLNGSYMARIHYRWGIHVTWILTSWKRIP